MEKYIRTFYGEEPVILNVHGCENCPLMKFYEDKLISVCRYFSGNGKDAVVDPFVVDYRGGLVREHINIPNWCGLPSTFKDLKNYRRTFKPYKNNLLIDSTTKYNDDTIKIINTEIETTLDDFFLQLLNESFESDESKSNNNIDDIIRKDSEILSNMYNLPENTNDLEKYGYQIPIKSEEVCSCCGKRHESVDRNKNIGMCNDCWEQFKNNEGKKKNVFIINFRMKRDKLYTNQTFKTI